MIELEIPTLATLAAVAAFDGRADDEDRIYAAIESAAPIIVAVELRRLANENDPVTRVARVARVWLSERANELDPPVVGA